MANPGFGALIAAVVQEKMMMGKKLPTQFAFDNPPPPALQTRSARLLRSIQELVDFEPLRDIAASYFAETGRSSIDPVVMIKMMLLGYLFHIPSDRQLVDECGDRISFREFLGFGYNDSVPVHASFTHWRQRLGEGFFRRALHQIVMQCAGQGMKLSGARTVDATTVKAQADKRGPVIEVPRDADVARYVEELFATEPDAETADESTEKPTENPAAEAVETADGPVAEAMAESVVAGANNSTEKRTDEPRDEPSGGGATIAINRHDPDARLQRKTREVAQFRYNVSFSADAESGLICDASAEAWERAETAVAHVDHDPGHVEELAADALYDSGEVLAELQEREATVRAGPRYEQLQRRRRINEHLNMLGKRDHCLARARSVGLNAMRIQAALTAMAINLCKLVRHCGSGPAGGGLGLSAVARSATRPEPRLEFLLVLWILLMARMGAAEG